MNRQISPTVQYVLLIACVSIAATLLAFLGWLSRHGSSWIDSHPPGHTRFPFAISTRAVFEACADYIFWSLDLGIEGVLWVVTLSVWNTYAGGIALAFEGFVLRPFYFIRDKIAHAKTPKSPFLRIAYLFILHSAAVVAFHLVLAKYRLPYLTLSGWYNFIEPNHNFTQSLIKYPVYELLAESFGTTSTEVWRRKPDHQRGIDEEPAKNWLALVIAKLSPRNRLGLLWDELKRRWALRFATPTATPSRPDPPQLPVFLRNYRPHRDKA